MLRVKVIHRDNLNGTVDNVENNMNEILSHLDGKGKAVEIKFERDLIIIFYQPTLGDKKVPLLGGTASTPKPKGRNNI